MRAAPERDDTRLVSNDDDDDDDDSDEDPGIERKTPGAFPGLFAGDNVYY